MRNKVVSIAEWGAVVLVALIIAFLSFQIWNFRFDGKTSIPINESIVLQIFVSLALLFLCVLIEVITKNISNRIKSIISYLLLGLTLVYVFVYGYLFIVQTKILPTSDAKACYDIALRFLNSEFKAVVPKGSYLSLWPFQTGFIFILEKQMRLFKSVDIEMFQVTNLIFILLLIISGYEILRNYTKRLGACVLYLAVMATHYSLILRAYIVYGNVPALALMMFSLWMFIVFSKTSNVFCKVFTGALFSISTIIACTYKTVCYIYLISLIIVVALMLIKKRKWVVGIVVLFTVIIAMNSVKITQKYYENYAGDVCGKGVPAMAYLAMGLQHNGENAIPGGWNGYHSDLFIQEDYDYEKVAQLSKESIRDSLYQFKEDKRFALDFFYYKAIKQWADQTHWILLGIDDAWDSSRDANSYWVKCIYNHTYDKLLIFMDYHESLLYMILFFSIIVLVVGKFKGKMLDEVLIPVVFFIGGFIFSLIWEAQPQATLYYTVLLLPFSVATIFELLNKRSGQNA